MFRGGSVVVTVQFEVRTAGFLGFKVDFYGQSTGAFYYVRLVSKMVQVFAGDRVGGGDDHKHLLTIIAVAFGRQLLVKNRTWQRECKQMALHDDRIITKFTGLAVGKGNVAETTRNVWF